jgi:hypothetical protein
MSCLIMYTQLRGISALSAPELLNDTVSSKEKKLQNIYNNSSTEYNIRNFLRYNVGADLFQEIKRLGFQVDMNIANPYMKDKAYRAVLKNEFELDDRSCLFIYYPFVAYTMVPAQPVPQLINYPAVNLLQYKMSMTPDGFPQVTRKNVYMSLLDGFTKK